MTFGAASLWLSSRRRSLRRSTCSAPELAKVQMDCRVETKVSPRNDNFGACRVTLIVIAKAQPAAIHISGI